ncbi:uracil-DNA glycosylase family protein [Natronobacterium texcoconense]|uniref:Uracil-DNA glycosylase, family 4 n=1 Tax=Natronobacterium texcoconense TaxID=1095778 RepID=A0A1H1C8K5_NATTX|nr:uracil-DNA glycosylase family protein [Natronobacterium texcoconense]SDQ60439.1 uracil-DNA glycosylase, family 4 [Natronobacterium texcoconense]
MKNVTDRTSNPFGLRPPFDRTPDGERTAVFGYGDANADFHVIGDHPGVHGGKRTGVPFTETESGRGVQDVFRETGFVTGPEEKPELENLYLNYVHMCCLPNGHEPSQREYDDLERYFDAELRAINAHILLPVGETATDHVLQEYTTQRRRFELDMANLHARQLRGRGFMVVPIREPSEWDAGDREKIVSSLEEILASDYRQTKGVATLVG